MRASDSDATVKMVLDPAVNFETWIAMLQMVQNLGFKDARSFISLNPGKETSFREVTIGSIQKESDKSYQVESAK